MSSISVIIPTYNRYEMLIKTIPSYLQSSLVGEIILVDDCSRMEVWQKIKTLSGIDPRIRCIRNEKNSGPSASRNRGISAANGEFLLLSEDDLELDKNHLEVLTDHLEKNQADIASGRRLWMRIGETKQQALNRVKQPGQTVVNLRWLDVNTMALPPDDSPSPLIDATMLMRKKVVEQIKYFEPFGGVSGWREESDFQLQALEKGFKLIFCPHVIGFHHARASASFGARRLRGNLNYLLHIFKHNRLFLDRHSSFLLKNYPSSLVLKSPGLTSIFYVIKKAIWLTRVEVFRWVLSRKNQSFEWK